MAIRTALGMLPGTLGTAGMILGGGGGAVAGLPELGVGAIPGAAVGGTAGLAAGSGTGKALENLGLQLFGLSPHPGILAKTMGADPASPTGQTLGVIEEMAKNAVLAKGMQLAGGSQSSQLAAFTAAKSAAGTGAKLAARTALRGKLGPLYDVLEHLGIKLARKGTPQMVAKQLERDPVFTQLGATITERPGATGPVSEGPDLLGAAMRGQPAPTPLGAVPVGGTVGQMPGGPTAPMFSPRLPGLSVPGPMPLGATIGQQATQEIAAQGPSIFEQAMTQAIQAERATPPAPVPVGTKIAPGEVRLSYGQLSPDPMEAMNQSLELEQKMNQLGFSSAQKAAVRRRVMGAPAKPMKLGNIGRGKRTPVGPVQ